MKKLLCLLTISTPSICTYTTNAPQEERGFFSTKPVTQAEADRILYDAAIGNDPQAQKALTDLLANPKNPQPNPNVPLGGTGQACLHAACSSSDVTLFRLLISLGADPHQQDRWGRTPLHHAALTCNLFLVIVLLQAGADVCARDDQGHMPVDNLKHALCTNACDKTLIQKLLRP